MSESNRSPSEGDIINHYSSGYEAERLSIGAGNLERERTREILKKFLPNPPATLLDIGGGAGSYGCWLATSGYQVHLIDLVPLHVEMAKQESKAQAEFPLASVSVGDARMLSWGEASFDGVLLFGPLYHLTDKTDRIKALREAYRVLRQGGLLFAVGISRFASTMDGLNRGLLLKEDFADIVRNDLLDGQHRNPTNNAEYFMDTFFHHPKELENELIEAGFNLYRLCSIEGPSWLVKEFDQWWDDMKLRSRLLEVSRALETEPSVIGVSAHIMGIGIKQ